MVGVYSELSEEFEVKMGMHQGSVLSPFLLAVVLDAFTEFARDGELGEVMYADDLVLISETIEGLRNKFLKWILRVLPVAVTGSPNLLCCILRYFTDFAFCCCVV